MANKSAEGVRKAVTQACYLYRGARFEDTLRRDIGWREARQMIRGRDPFGGRWTARPGGRAMRLTNGGLEVRFLDGVEVVSWESLQNRLQWRRN